MLPLLKAQDVHYFLYENNEAPFEEHREEAKATFLIKKSISFEAYYLARNLTRSKEICSARLQYYSS